MCIILCISPFVKAVMCIYVVEFLYNYLSYFVFQVQLANANQLGDHYSSKHPKEKPPSDSTWVITR